ncbi:MAG: hypothetical protein PHE18_01560 [Candidatus Omnitrophica bacterium]|nr:hypothetical protein [Candidatus Omnitrophota bacterium]MDD5552541.1 hypothetical protein [Candidatus Omnitrophota bacterium]
MRRNKGQSILEYVIVLTAIVAVIVIGAAKFASKDKGSGVGKLMDSAGSKITTSTGKIAEIK